MASLRTLAIIGAVLTTSSAAFSQPYGGYTGPSRCVSNCGTGTPSKGHTPSALSVNYQGFLDVLRSFHGLTPIADLYTKMEPPPSLPEYENRVTRFYESATREQDRLAQRLERARANEDTARTLLAQRQAEVDYYSPLVAQLEQKFEPIRDRGSALGLELHRLRDAVDRTRDAEKEWSRNAQRARNDVVEIIQSAAPPRLLLVTGDKLAQFASFSPQTPTRPREPSEPLRAAAAAHGGEAAAAWTPLDRALGIDLSLPAAAKIERLRSVASNMRNTVQTFNRDSAALQVIQRMAYAADHKRDELRSRLEVLDGAISGYSRMIEEAEQEIPKEKAALRRAGDQMMLRAVQAWIWRSFRDKIVIPKVNQFLIRNGARPIAKKLRADAVLDFAESARKLKWQGATRVRGANEFMAVQRKVLALLDPLMSRVLQSAELNALVTTEEAQSFRREVGRSLGDDGEELVEAAGQTNFPGPYRGVAAKLLAD